LSQNSITETANGVLRDAVQGVLYIQNVMRFFGARLNIIQFTPTYKARPSPLRFSWAHKWLANYVQISYNEFHPIRAINEEAEERIYALMYICK